MADKTYRATLSDGTVVMVEDSGGPMVHARASKGKFHRVLPLFRAEVAVLAELLARVPKE